jgi:hypothetical protein
MYSSPCSNAICAAEIMRRFGTETLGLAVTAFQISVYRQRCVLPKLKSPNNRSGFVLGRPMNLEFVIEGVYQKL